MIAGRLLAWFDQHGRHDLPWQHPRTPYRVWLAEIMLQQTQVATVIPYFLRFTATLPTLSALAAATEDQVMALWSGLGYYRRARFAQRSARMCVERHGGKLPADFDQLCALPGIGRSTAGAILAAAFNQRWPILDGNVKRVLTRHEGLAGYPGARAVENALWRIAEYETPAQRIADYTQAIMDLGATVCTRANPHCEACPLATSCVAYRQHLTAVLPTPRPRRSVPTRRTVMLIARDERGRVWLRKRGPDGVWGGLWSLPEAASLAAARRAAEQLLHTTVTQRLPAFEHAFTHYRLTILPLLITGEVRAGGVGEANVQRWIGPEQLANLGVPAPVRRLLEALAGGDETASTNPDTTAAAPI